MRIAYSSEVKIIICRLVIDHIKRTNTPIHVQDILATFAHPEVKDFKIEAELWFETNNCRADDSVIPIHTHIAIILIVPRPDLGKGICINLP